MAQLTYAVNPAGANDWPCRAQGARAKKMAMPPFVASSPTPSPPILPPLPEPLASPAGQVVDLVHFVSASSAFSLLLLCAFFLYAGYRVTQQQDLFETLFTLLLGFGLLVGANTLFELRIDGVPAFGNVPDWKNAPLVGPVLRGEGPFGTPDPTLSPLERAHERDSERY